MSFFSIVESHAYHDKLPESGGYPGVFLAYVDPNTGNYTSEPSSTVIIQKGPYTYTTDLCNDAKNLDG